MSLGLPCEQKLKNSLAITQEKNQSFGINPSRIINGEKYERFNEILQCKLCFKLLNNPHDCARCGNSFCLDCITKQKENSMPCPFYCEDEEFPVKQSSMGIINILNSLKFYCINKESGCDQEISYSELKEHDLLCKFATVRCPNTNCNETIRRVNLEYHISHECHSSLFKCDICKADFLRSDFLNHYQTCKIISGALNPINKNDDNKNLMNEKKKYSNTQTNLSIDNTRDSNEDQINKLKVSQHRDIKSDFQNFMDSVEFKNINLDSFLKIILFNLGKINQNLDGKIDQLHEEVNTIKSDVKQMNKEVNINLKNLNTNIESEIDALNDRISMLNISLHPNDEMKKVVEDGFKNMCEKIESKTSIDGSFIYGQDSKSELNDNLNKNNSVNSSKIINNNIQVKESKFNNSRNNNLNNMKVKNNAHTNSNSSSNTGNSDTAKPRNRIEIGKKIINKESLSTGKTKTNNTTNTNNRNILNTSINRDALSPKNRSPARNTILNINSRAVKFDENRNTNQNKDMNLIKIRERSTHHFCTNSGNAYHPIQTSYEAIQATLRNHELIIELLNKILEKMDKDLAKDANIDKIFNFIVSNLNYEDNKALRC